MGGELPTVRTALAVSLLSATAVLIRMDSVVVLAVPLGLVAWRALRRTGAPGGATDGARRPPAFEVLAALAVPAAVVIVSWMLWRHSEYGQWLPNTAVAKGRTPGRTT